MARAKQASKRKRRKTALPAWGAAGVSLAMAGGASAAVAPTPDVPSQHTALHPAFVLGEEEISDVSLATFYVFDRENVNLGERLQLAARGGCGGCRGCGGARGCAGRGCAGVGARCAGVGARCAGVARCAVGRCAVARCAVARCRCGCGVGVVGCAGCGCSCSGCTGICWTWAFTGWAYVC
jgi:hypothetical protein